MTLRSRLTRIPKSGRKALCKQMTALMLRFNVDRQLQNMQTGTTSRRSSLFMGSSNNKQYVGS